MLDFQIRKPESVNAEFLIIILDGQIAALVKKRDGIMEGRVYVCQQGGVGLLKGKPGDIIIRILHYLHQEGWSSGFEPVFFEPL